MSNKNSPDNVKREDFLFWFFFLILPIIGVVLGIVAYLNNAIWLMLLALPMMLSFFITALVFFISAFKDHAKNNPEPEEIVDYKGTLNLSDEMILANKNPYCKDMIKTAILTALLIFVPLGLANLPALSDVMISDIYVKNILKAATIFLPFCSILRGWKDIRSFLDFWQAKRYLINREEGKKVELFPKINFIAILFLFLLVVVSSSYFNDVKTVREYRANGVSVDAEIYKVEDAGDDDHYVYFKYAYNGKEYSYMKENYAGGTKIGKKAEAYLYPDNPEDLYLHYSSAFAVYIMLLFFCFFILLENGFNKRARQTCFVFSGILTISIGIFASAAVHIIFGVIMLVLAFFTWFKKKKINYA